MFCLSYSFNHLVTPYTYLGVAHFGSLLDSSHTIKPIRSFTEAKSNYETLHLNCVFSHDSHNALVVFRKQSNPQTCCRTEQKLHLFTAPLPLLIHTISNTSQNQTTVFKHQYGTWPWNTARLLQHLITDSFTCNTCHMPTQKIKMTKASVPLKQTAFILFSRQSLESYTNSFQLSKS